MRFLLACLFFAQTASANPPKVVTDIAPIHSLVSMVMEDIADPELLLSKSNDPHHVALRPSQASDIQKADIIIAVGGGLTPWLDRARENLAPDATYIDLMQAEPTQTLKARESTDFSTHDTHDHHDHGHEGDFDPHGWLDPENARVWLAVIADALAMHDPDNADAYKANAAKASGTIGSLQMQMSAQLSPHSSEPFVLFHDAFHYFETRFDLNALAAITLSDTTDPGVAWLRDLRKMLVNNDVACLFSNEGSSAKQLKILAEGLDVQIVPLDPLGQRFTPGAGLYIDMLGAVASDMARCLGR